MDVAAVIERRARVEGDLVLVDEFLNHRVEPGFIAAVGSELAERFAPDSPDLVLTAEASGIPPALACGLELDVPVVYAKKYPRPGTRTAYVREVRSPTKGVEYRVEVAHRVLGPGLGVLVVDDFLSGGRTAEALGQIVEEAGSEVVGFGFVVEKAYAEGRRRLVAHGWRVESLAVVESIVDGRPVFASSTTPAPNRP